MGGMEGKGGFLDWCKPVKKPAFGLVCYRGGE
jgi:hypothetical protein